MSKPQFRCPPSMMAHVRKVLAGEYDVPGFAVDAPHVLDIGANIGAFSVWALGKWSGARVVAYEPWPSNAAMYRANLGDRPSMLIEAAVYCQGKLTMYEGRSNCGECSLWCGPEQVWKGQGTEVPGVSPSCLDACDFLKLDAEGAELGILAGYRHLDKVGAVALETHSERDARVIRFMLEDAGLTLVSEDVWRKDRSVQRWLRKS